MICQQFELSEKRIFILNWFGKYNWSPLGRMINAGDDDDDELFLWYG